MKPEEIRAEEYLKSLFIGEVTFEPHGNVAPDFEVDKDIAVEVRRLNQSYVRGGKLRGLEEDRIPLTQKIKKVIESFQPLEEVESELSWFVCFSIRQRPIEAWSTIAVRLNRFLLDFYLGDRSAGKTRLTRSIEITIIPASNRLNTFFRLGGSSDFEAGGWVISELSKNIGLCIHAKSEVAKSLTKYRERWLLLIDHIGYGHLEKISIDREEWDKVIVLAPYGKLIAYEPSALDRAPILKACTPSAPGSP
jgi:hypothetical protein